MVYALHGTAGCQAASALLRKVLAPVLTTSDTGCALPFTPSAEAEAKTEAIDHSSECNHPAET